MKTKAVLFDLWSTLAESQLKDTFNKIVNLVGKENESYLNSIWHGFWDIKNIDSRQFFEYAFKPIGKEDLVDKAIAIRKKKIDQTDLFPEAMEVLKALKKKKLKLAIISNTQPDTIRVIKKHKLDKIFDYIGFSCFEGITKPSKEFFEIVLEKIKVTPERAIMVGDNLKQDVEGAINAGIKGLLIDRKNRYPDYKERITSLKEIERFLE